MIQRPDFDPGNKLNFIKTEKVDIRKKSDFNDKTNFYDYIREVDFELGAPDARGYINLPNIVDRKKPFSSLLQKTKEKAKLTEIALKKELLLPQLDESGKVQIFGKDIMKRPFKFSEVLKLGEQMRGYALTYLNQLQEIEFAQSPEFVLMLEMLSAKSPGLMDTPETSEISLKDKVEEGSPTIKTSLEKKPSLTPKKPTTYPTLSPEIKTTSEHLPLMSTPIHKYVPISYNTIFNIVKYIIANIPIVLVIKNALSMRRRRAKIDQLVDFLVWCVWSVIIGGFYTGIFTLVGIAQDYFNKGYYDVLVIEEYVKEFFVYLSKTVPIFPLEVGVYLVILVTHVIIEMTVQNERQKIREKKAIYRTIIKGFNKAYKGLGSEIDERMGDFIEKYFDIELKDVIVFDEKFRKMTDTDRVIANIVSYTYKPKNLRQEKFSIKYDVYDKEFIIDMKKSNELISYYDSDNAALLSIRGVKHFTEIGGMTSAVFFNIINQSLARYKGYLKSSIKTAQRDSKNEYIILAGHSQGAYLISLVYTELIAKTRPTQKFSGFLFCLPIQHKTALYPLESIVQNENFRKFGMLQDWTSNSQIMVFGRKNVSMFDAPFSFLKSHNIDSFTAEDLNAYLMKLDENSSYDLKFSEFLKEYYIG